MADFGRPQWQKSTSPLCNELFQLKVHLSVHSLIFANHDRANEQIEFAWQTLKETVGWFEGKMPRMHEYCFSGSRGEIPAVGSGRVIQISYNCF
jgi:hypothetical protein